MNLIVDATYNTNNNGLTLLGISILGLYVEEKPQASEYADEPVKTIQHGLIPLVQLLGTEKEGKEQYLVLFCSTFRLSAFEILCLHE